MAIIHYFGRFSDIADGGDVTLPQHVTDTDALTRWLAEDNERFAAEWRRPGAPVVVNQEIARGTHPIGQGDEIAFMSALSGG